MNNRQKQFCDEYMIDLNATQAAIRAGYSVKTARSISEELLTKPDIAAEIGRRMAERSKRTGVTADRVVMELARIAFVNPLSVVDLESGCESYKSSADDLAAISSVKVRVIPGRDRDGYEREVKFCDKVRALELLGKHLGMFVDKVNLSGAVPVIISGEDQLED